NSVLDNVPGIEGINEEVKQRILSEAHFFRALSYFNLVRGFGPVPIKIHESVDVSSVGSPREPESAVYDLILSDVLEAEKNLPSDVGAETGRLSVWSAKMLLAQIYLTLEQWSDAAAKAKEIMDSGVFELITVSQASDFYHIFATNTNAEYILALQQSETRQSSLPQFLHRPSTPPYNYSSSGFFAWLPDTTSFIGDAWDDADLRKSFNLYHSYIGPDGEMVSLPSSSPVLFGKFITTPDGIRSYSAPIFRLAETYLIYAEADAMATGSVTTEALEALNVIRRRAYGMDPHSASEIDYLGDVSVAEFQDLVLQEKAYEFIVEGQRWWDLKRTGKVEEAMTAADKEFRSERLLWPLPEDEINNNPDINQEDQNPGY
ncbi:MAG: RagB/SusD family nutrient uptake outer membrane protein, partial [Saprospiraceae bacterium]|nr:RagB/SusD family nutrient uptake outer membrane protein [Saprospiraceae bacterium]